MPENEQVRDVTGDGAMRIEHTSGRDLVAIAVEAMTSESLCIVAFQHDREAAAWFRRWVSSPEVLEQFRRWVDAEHKLPGHSRACALGSGCTCAAARTANGQEAEGHG